LDWIEVATVQHCCSSRFSKLGYDVDPKAYFREASRNWGDSFVHVTGGLKAEEVCSVASTATKSVATANDPKREDLLIRFALVTTVVPVLKITRPILIGSENSLPYLIRQPDAKLTVLTRLGRIGLVLNVELSRFHHGSMS
jgi:hypothetical protein